MNDLIYPVCKNLHVFDDDKFGVVRVHMIGGIPHYLSNDVTKILGYSDNKEAISKYVNDYDKIYVNPYENSTYYVFLNDCALYCLATNSEKEFAIDFRNALSICVRNYAIDLYNDKVFNARSIIKNNWEIISSIIKSSINIINEKSMANYINDLRQFFMRLESNSSEKVKDTFLYFIKDKHGNTKIGISNNVYARLSTLQIGNADKLDVVDSIGPMSRKDALLLEKELHNKFNMSHVSGEWFDITDWEIQDIINRKNC